MRSSVGREPMNPFQTGIVSKGEPAERESRTCLSVELVEGAGGAANSFDSFPRFNEQRAIAAEIDRLGYKRPYFLVHEGRAGA